MVLGIIFVVMAVVLAAMLPFLNKYAERKARAGRYKKNNGNENNKAKKINRSNLYNIWEIEDVQNGIIKMNDGSLRAILSLGSLDYRLLSEPEQTAVESALMSFAMAINFPVQFLVVTENADIRGFINEINVDETWPEKTRIYAKNLSAYLEEMIKNRTVPVRKSYVVISSPPENDHESACKEILRKCQIVISSLARAHVTARLLHSDSVVNLIHGIMSGSKLVKPAALVAAGSIEMIITGRGIKVGAERPAQEEAGNGQEAGGEHARSEGPVRAGYAG